MSINFRATEDNDTFAEAVLSDGTILRNVIAGRFSGHDTDVCFRGRVDGDFVFVPSHAILRLVRGRP
jgi:hypothetical protein